MDTRDRILDGAGRALARHGLTKLGMSDISSSAGVSRATLYRYFPSLDVVLTDLSTREAERFRDELLTAVANADEDQRLGMLLLAATETAQSHPVLQRLLASEPGLVLEAVRRQYPVLRARIGELIGPLLVDTPAGRAGADVPALVDGFVRLLFSTYLFPDPDPAAMQHTVQTFQALLTEGGPS